MAGTSSDTNPPLVGEANPSSGKSPTLPKIKNLLLPYDQNDAISFLSEFFTKIQTLSPNSQITLDFSVPNFSEKKAETFIGKQLNYRIVERNNNSSTDAISQDYQDAAVLYPSDLSQMVLDTIPLIKKLNNNTAPQALDDFSSVMASEITAAPINEIRIFNLYKDRVRQVSSEVLALLDYLSGKTQINPNFEELQISQVGSGEFTRVIEATLVPLLKLISQITTSTSTSNRDYPIQFNGKQYSFAQVKNELNKLILKINHDFSNGIPGNQTLSSVRKKINNTKFVQAHISEVKTLEANGSSLVHRLRFIDLLPGYKIVFNKYPNDFVAFESIDPDAYPNTSDTQTAQTLHNLFVALLKLDGFSAVQEDQAVAETAKPKDEVDQTEQTEGTQKGMDLAEFLETAFDSTQDNIEQTILLPVTTQAITNWGNRNKDSDLDISDLETLIVDSLSKNQTINQKIYALFSQSKAVKEAQVVAQTNNKTDLIPFYDEESKLFIPFDESGKVESTYENWLQILYEELFEKTVNLYLTEVNTLLKNLIEQKIKEKQQEQPDENLEEIATSGIPANISELLKRASELQSKDPRAFRETQDQLFETSGLHKDLHLQMQSILLSQLNSQGFLFTRVDEIPLEIRMALFSDLQNYLYSLSTEELTRVLSDRTTRTQLLAEFNRRLQLGQLPLSGVISRFVANNQPTNKQQAQDESTNPETILSQAIQDYVDPSQTDLASTLRDPEILSGYSSESGQSLAEYLQIRFKRQLTQEELNWFNDFLLFYIQQYAVKQSTTQRNLGNTGQVLPFDDINETGQLVDQATKPVDSFDEGADYVALRNYYLSQLAQEQQQAEQNLSGPGQIQVQSVRQPKDTPYSSTQNIAPQQATGPQQKNQYLGQLQDDSQDLDIVDSVTAEKSSTQESKKKKSLLGRLGQNTAIRTALYALQQIISLISNLVSLAIKAIPFLLGLGAKAITFLAGLPFFQAVGIAAATAGAAFLALKGLELVFNLAKGLFEFVGNALTNIFNGLSSLFSGSAPASSYAVATATAAVGVTTIIMQNTASDGMYLLTQESLDVETSKYLEIEKTATPTRLENNTPTEITYTITIKAKDEYVVTPKLDTVTDTFSNIGKVTGLPDEVAHNQAVKDALRNKLGVAQENTSELPPGDQDTGTLLNDITSSGVTIEYSLPALSGEDVFVVNTFKLDFSVIDTQAEGSPRVEESWKDSASIRIGDPTFSDCFVFVDNNTPETEKIAAAKARIGAREGGLASIVDWSDDEITTLLAAFSTRVTENTGFMSSLKCDSSSEFGPILLFRLKANGILYGGWSIDENAIGFFDETFNYSLTSTEYTVIHELGHTIDKRNAQFRTRFDSIGGGCPPTYNISSCTDTEPFAEAIALFVIYPDYTFNLGGPTRTTYDFPGQRRQQYCKIKEIVFDDKDIEDGRPTISCN